MWPDYLSIFYSGKHTCTSPSQRSRNGPTVFSVSPPTILSAANSFFSLSPMQQQPIRHSVPRWLKHRYPVKSTISPFSSNYPGMPSLPGTKYILLLQVRAKLVHVQSNHRLGSRSHHQNHSRQLLDQLIFPGNCSCCLR